MKLFVSGLINVETNLKIRSFPVTYYPIDYPFFGINSTVSGVGYNISKAVKTLGDEVVFASLIGKDNEAQRIINELDDKGVSRNCVFDYLDRTPVSVVLYEPGSGGRRQIYCDLKDIQDHTYGDAKSVFDAIERSDMCVLCNINFNRSLLPIAKAAGKTIATDVHVLSDIFDPFNRDFMSYADILFLSDEEILGSPRDFLEKLKNEYSAKIIVIGLGSDGVIMYERAYDAYTELPAVDLGGVVNTVGAGDALFSAFIHYYNRCGALEAIKKAEIFTALKIRHDGGSVGFSTEEQVEEIYRTYKF
ncbi:MAG: carbohydrate kinase family protein [Clostridiales bacterium]|nr:carbohydrate kinase family protein [Clostridiales bacterium]